MPDDAPDGLVERLRRCEERTKRAAERVTSTRAEIARLEAVNRDSGGLRAELCVYEQELAAQCKILEALIEQAKFPSSGK